MTFQYEIPCIKTLPTSIRILTVTDSIRIHDNILEPLGLVPKSVATDILAQSVD